MKESYKAHPDAGKQKFTSLLHHITPELLRASFFDLKNRAAPGVDGETWSDYAVEFERQIDDQHGRFHRVAYWAKPAVQKIGVRHRTTRTSNPRRLRFGSLVMAGNRSRRVWHDSS